jgi:protein-S-isoprenylcysteine O-methyltransferase Ste14
VWSSAVRPLPFSNELVYVVLFWTIFAFWLAMEGFASIVKRTRVRRNTRDRGSLLLIILFFWLGILLCFSLSFLLPQMAILGNQKFIFLLGLVLMLAGIAFRWHAMSVLGRFFTVNVSIQEGHTLVETGPYRYIRHPSYTGALSTEVGIGLAFGNWASLLALLVCAGIAYAYRISIEEKALLAALGDPYRNYMRRTCRLIPFVF